MPADGGGAGPRLPGAELARELVAELARDRFTPAAWRRFFRRAWHRSRSDIIDHPSRAWSFFRWAGLAAALGIAVLVLARVAQPSASWALSGALWAPWFALSAGYVLLHLGAVESDEGEPRRTLLWPNGLTFLRLAHAPLVSSVLDAANTGSRAALLLCIYLGLVAGTDLLDGLLARGLRQTSRLGRTLDPIADMALLVALALGLHRHGMIPTLLLILLIVRYPGALVAGIILTFARGPLTIRHTLIGRVTSFAASFILVAAAVVLLSSPSWLPRAWIAGALWALSGLVGLNIGYLLYRAART
jgi:cardiolipin synthase